MPSVFAAFSSAARSAAAEPAGEAGAAPDAAGAAALAAGAAAEAAGAVGALAAPPHFPFQPPSVHQPSRPLMAPPPAEPARPPAVARPAEALIAKLAPSSQEPAETAVAPTVTCAVFSPSLASRAPQFAANSLRVEGPAPQQATVLRVAVDGIGAARFVLLAESSGSTAADNLGIRQVKQWRFETAARSADALDWGDVRIIWVGSGEAPAAPGAKGGAR